MSSKELPIEEIVTRAVVTEIPKNSIIVLSVPLTIYKNDMVTMDRLQRHIQDMFRNNPVFIIDDRRDPTDVFTAVDESTMNRLGWYKK